MTHPDGNPAGNSAADRALLDYLDSLLHDSGSDISASLDLFPIEEAARGAAGHAGYSAQPSFRGHTNVTSLPTHPRMSRPQRVVEPLKLPATESPLFAESLRPFAEPSRPLKLTTLLPPVASVEVSTQVPVEMKVEQQVVVETPVSRPTITTEMATPVVKAPVTEAPATEAPVTITPTKIAPPPVASAPIPEAVVDAPANAPAAWAANGRPQWAQQKFECLLFTTGGLKLAVPLVELGSIYPLESDDISSIFGQVDWFLGLVRIKQGNLRIVDTARIVMPERYDVSMPDAYRYVISLSNCDWALGADAISGTVLLDPEQVRWRGERSKRPWLAGTVIEQMCALLDVAQLAQMFDQQDRKR